MSKILIENYRGFDIEFDTNAEKFQCIVTEDNAKESVSFTAVKKFVDEYKKINQSFNPFWITPIPSSCGDKAKRKIVGIRKDGRFVSEDTNGNKEQFSEYYEKDWMLVKPENETILSSLETIKSEFKEKETAYKAERDRLISTLNIVNLKDYKSQIK